MIIIGIIATIVIVKYCYWYPFSCHFGYHHYSSSSGSIIMTMVMINIVYVFPHYDH